MSLLKQARLTRRQLIMFALVSAAINGIMTASVGAWLAQTYSTTQHRRQSIEKISHLIYERRARLGLVVSSLRRNAELDELRHRKRNYDEIYIEWNKEIRLNLITIREVMGERELATLEQDFEELVVAPLSRMDNCLTKAYDERIANRDPLPLLEACEMPLNYQVTLDCGASFTKELFKLTRLSFNPLAGVGQPAREAARQRIVKGCARPEKP